MKTQAERKRLERERKRAAGLTRLDVWVRADYKEKILTYIEKMNAKPKH